MIFKAGGCKLIVCCFLEAVAAIDFRILGMLDIRVVSGCGSPGSIRCTAAQLHTSHLNEVKIFRGTRKMQCSKLPTRCLREIRCSLCKLSRRNSVLQKKFCDIKTCLSLGNSWCFSFLRVISSSPNIADTTHEFRALISQSVPEPKW